MPLPPPEYRDFLKCYEFVKKWEGGEVLDPADPGGHTNRGITQRVYNAVRSSKGLPIQAVSFITEEEVLDIYRQDYWILAGCNEMRWPLSLVVFDTAVNCGVSQTLKWLQRCVLFDGPEVDGAWGPKTRDAVNVRDPELLAQKVMAMRLDHYHQLAFKHPSLAKFLTGWLNRVDALEKACTAKTMRKPAPLATK